MKRLRVFTMKLLFITKPTKTNNLILSGSNLIVEWKMSCWEIVCGQMHSQSYRDTLLHMKYPPRHFLSICSRCQEEIVYAFSGRGTLWNRSGTRQT